MSSAADVPVVLLLGGGVESSLLLTQFVRAGRNVCPVHLHCGFIWEDCESAYVRRLLEANACARLLPLIEIRYPHLDVMRTHWAVTGVGAPRAGESPQALELPLRNLTLLSVAGWRMSHLPELLLVMGTTKDNSYSDGTREFFDCCGRLLTLNLRRPVKVQTPLLHLSKRAVMRQASRDTLALSFSCIDPKNGLHCSTCYKCSRRKAAFQAAGVADPTRYAVTS